MYLKKSIAMSAAFCLILASCSVPNQSLNNSQDATQKEEFGFGIKGGAQPENENPLIKYSGNWMNVVNEASAGGSHAVGSTVLESNNPNMLFYPDEWTTVEDNSANAGSYRKSTSEATLLAEDFTGSGAPQGLSYSAGGSAWINNYTGTSSSRSYNYGAPLVLENTGVTLNGDGWAVSGVNSYNLNNSAASVEFSFTGSNVDISGRKGPNSGIIRITVMDNDNNVEKTYENIDLYNASGLASRIIKIKGLKNALHKVKIEIQKDGEQMMKNAASTGFRMDFDKAVIYPAIEYLFNGKSIRYFGWKWNKMGNVELTIDDKPAERIDLYSPSVNPVKALIKEYSDLSEGPHRLLIEATGTKYADSLNPGISLDKFDRVSMLSAPFSGTGFNLRYKTGPDKGKMNIYIYNTDGEGNKTPVPSFMINGVSRALPYPLEQYSATAGDKIAVISGLSEANHLITLAGRNEKNASSTGYEINFDAMTSSASYDFSGTGIDYYAAEGPDMGIVNLFIDNQFHAAIDLYSATPRLNRKVFSKRDLPLGNHKVEIRQAGRKNPASTGYNISLDNFNSVKFEGEFQVNTFTTDKQQAPAIAVNKKTGDYVVVWQSYKQNSTTGYVVYGQRYDRFDNKLGGEFRISSASMRSSSEANVAVADNGNFVVVWRDTVNSTGSVQLTARLYNAAGSPLTSYLPVYSAPTGNAAPPSVKFLPNGNFIISFSGTMSSTSSTLFARLYSNTGTALGSHFQVDTPGLGGGVNYAPTVMGNSSGKFAIVWHTNTYSASTNTYPVKEADLRFYNSDGTPSGTEIRVNGISSVVDDAIMDEAGNIFMVWDDGYMRIRKFDSAGSPLTSVLNVTPRGPQQSGGTLDIDKAGNLIVGYSVNNTGITGEGTSYAVFGQRFDNNLNKIGPEFRVNTTSEGQQNEAEVAMDDQGNFVFTWQDTLKDGNLSGVFAKSYDKDGIEQ